MNRSLKWPRFLVLSVLISAGSLQAANQVFHYEPDQVELSGTIERQTFPGPPNYESIRDGDKIEAGRYLRLDQPIDVKRSPRDENPLSETEPEKNVKILHLTGSSEKDIGLMKKGLIGKKVILKGHLFRRFTGHHHARVLMGVDSIREVSGK